MQKRRFWVGKSVDGKRNFEKEIPCSLVHDGKCRGVPSH